MQLGYNHNINYKQQTFHVQTEDSGLKNPHIVTLLYKDGVILGSQKISYKDALQVDQLDGLVEDLMKAQHKRMMYRLRNGEFDDKIFGTAEQQSAQQTDQQPAASATEPEADLTQTTKVWLQGLEIDQRPEEAVPDQETSEMQTAGEQPQNLVPDAVNSAVTLETDLDAGEEQGQAPATNEQEPSSPASLDEAILSFFK